MSNPTRAEESSDGDGAGTTIAAPPPPPHTSEAAAAARQSRRRRCAAKQSPANPPPPPHPRRDRVPPPTSDVHIPSTAPGGIPHPRLSLSPRGGVRSPPSFFLLIGRLSSSSYSSPSAVAVDSVRSKCLKETVLQPLVGRLSFVPMPAEDPVAKGGDSLAVHSACNHG